MSRWNAAETTCSTGAEADGSGYFEPRKWRQLGKFKHLRLHEWRRNVRSALNMGRLRPQLGVVCCGLRGHTIATRNLGRNWAETRIWRKPVFRGNERGVSATAQQGNWTYSHLTDIYGLDDCRWTGRDPISIPLILGEEKAGDSNIGNLWSDSETCAGLLCRQ
jgi:hypothetical protein